MMKYFKDDKGGVHGFDSVQLQGAQDYLDREKEIKDEIYSFEPTKETPEPPVLENEYQRFKVIADNLETLIELTHEEVEEHLNPTPTPEQLAEQARAERNALMEKYQPVLDRHRNERDTPDKAPTDSHQVYEAVLLYMAALRDVSQQGGFPESIEWPSEPEGIDWPSQS